MFGFPVVQPRSPGPVSKALAARASVVCVALADIVGCTDDVCVDESFEQQQADPRIRVAVASEFLVAAGAEGFLELGSHNVRPTATAGEFLGLSANYTASETPNHWAAVGRAGLIRYSGDGGRTWTAPEGPTSDRDLLAVAFSCVLPEIGVAVGDGGVILRSTTGGREWSAQPSPTTMALRGVVITWRDVAISVGDQGTVLRSSDGGSTWATVDSGTSENLRGVSAMAPCQWQINHPSDRRAIAVGDGGTVIYSEDDGETWKRAGVKASDQFRQVALFHPEEVRFSSALLLGERTLWRWRWAQDSLIVEKEFASRPETMILGAQSHRQGVIGDGTLWLFHASNCFDNS